MPDTKKRLNRDAFLLGVAFCLVLGASLGVTLILLWLPDHAPTFFYAEIALIIQTLLLMGLCAATWFRERRLNDQFNNLIEREAQISFLNARITNLINAAKQVAVITTNAQGQIQLLSDGARALFGLECESAAGRNYAELLHAKEDIDARRQYLTASDMVLSDYQLISQLSSNDNGESKATEWLYKRSDGSQFTGELRHARLNDSTSGDVEHINVIVDVSERIELLNRIQESKALLQRLTQRIPNVLYKYRLRGPGDGCFTFFSPSVENVLELKPETVIGVNFAGNPLFQRLHPDDLPWIRDATARSAQTGVGWNGEFRMLLPVKGLRWVRVESYAERQPDRSCVWYGSFSDITELKDREEKLRTQSITDELTSIYNRRHFMSSLHQLVETGKRCGTGFSLVVFDLDHFKSINDRFGHEVGDTVLKQTCLLIGQRLRTTDEFFRIGGEELAILCPQSSLESTEQLANMLCQLLAQHEIETAGTVTASFGVARWTEGQSAEALLRSADLASYEAKKNGRNRVICA